MPDKRIDNRRIDAQLSDLSPSKTLAASRERADQSTQTGGNSTGNSR